MSRSAEERFGDIVAAVDRCIAYRASLEDEEARIASMAYDAVLRNLAVIGEAVRALPKEETDRFPGVPWASIAGLRNVVVHEYFRVDRSIVIDIVDNQLVPLAMILRSRRQ
ncbi:HepT-like ribonuclease domain-containing protein [Rathayibacter sp. CAU 1779]